MTLEEGIETLLFILEQEQKDKCFQIWLHSQTGITFAEFWEQNRHGRQAEVRSREEIFAETDALFAGR